MNTLSLSELELLVCGVRSDYVSVDDVDRARRASVTRYASFGLAQWR